MLQARHLSTLCGRFCRQQQPLSLMKPVFVVRGSGLCAADRSFPAWTCGLASAFGARAGGRIQHQREGCGLVGLCGVLPGWWWSGLEVLAWPPSHLVAPSSLHRDALLVNFCDSSITDRLESDQTQTHSLVRLESTWKSGYLDPK